MNVGQLIEELRKLPQHVPVLAVLDSIIMPVENGGSTDRSADD